MILYYCLLLITIIDILLWILKIAWMIVYPQCIAVYKLLAEGNSCIYCKPSNIMLIQGN